MITRYRRSAGGNTGTGYLYTDKQGDVVLYEDYLKIVQKLEERVARLLDDVRELEESLDNAQRRMRAEGVRQYWVSG